MTRDHLRKLWTAVGAFLVFYALNTWLVSIGANPIVGIKLVDFRPVVASIPGILICAPLLILLSAIGTAYARDTKENRWHERMPVVWLDDVSTDSTAGKIYQAFFYVIFIVIPTSALAYFVTEIATAEVRCMDIPTSPIKAYHGWIDGCGHDRHRIGDNLESQQDSFDGTVTWFPVWEPMVLGLLVLAAWFSAMWMSFVAFLGR